jgi:rhodanese-related sulfurtransferase
MDQLIQFVTNHWQLWLALAVIVGILIFEETKKASSGIKRLSTQEITALMNHEDAVVIDFRVSTDYNAGHILGAINITETEFDKITKRLEAQKKQKLIVINTSETTAISISDKLAKAGFNICTLAGGFAAWKNASLPVSKK